MKLIFIILASFFTPSKGETDNGILFEITRNKDDFKIVYQLNLNEKGNVILKEPIKTYWLKNGKKEALSLIQEKYAYGLVVDKITDNFIDLHFAAYSQRIIRLKMNKKPTVMISEGDSWAMLRGIYVNFSNSSFLLPKIKSVKIELTNPKSCEDFIQTIKP
ncbi:DUF4833 domain-containing protein [Arcticibacterium luteifluviistationis]|uniref:DUF4833 domain-containing protein n=1 Tax=Arcticibacterium luteifluviistationis TaxID=1784714 RepID=A0A2Z4GBN8_9BACT|nr:DUF4833 domain-containing protein [Arcticibacterium luteifluviistationis]AWV98470.1 hypothetical protein DJ013_09915 [Arcticibacterium luteifluviistationis]